EPQDVKLFQQALTYWEGNETQKQHFINAVHYFQQAEDRINIPARRYLTLIYEFGNDIQKRFDNFLLTYKETALVEINKLAERYQEETTLNQNYERAVFWYEKLTELNYPNAFLTLGMMYENGEGVIK